MSSGPAPGLIIAAPASGSGKTTVTLALARALRRTGMRVACAKAGPDYIDPAFHAAASGAPCVNLDVWAMRPPTLAGLAERNADIVLCEGVMGLFDGIDAAGTGSTADLAALTGWPVLLVVDARGQSASAAALVAGFVRHRADVTVAGVLFNRVGGARHAAMLREALARTLPDIPVLGAIARDAGLAMPERHLGLVQAGEHPDLERFLDAAAATIAAAVDLPAIAALARRGRLSATAGPMPAVPPLGQRIAIAHDAAFAFAYPWLLEGWRRSGAELNLFSPLADEAPDAACDAVYLPGGYPELHAGRLAANRRFLGGLRGAAGRGVTIYGECGGYMVLGRTLVDGESQGHEMAGLLPLTTSFAKRKLHLGYRLLTLVGDTPGLGTAGTVYRGHEFHYASIVDEEPCQRLFEQADALGHALDPAGLRVDSVFGCFGHLIDLDGAK